MNYHQRQSIMIMITSIEQQLRGLKNLLSINEEKTVPHNKNMFAKVPSFDERERYTTDEEDEALSRMFEISDNLKKQEEVEMLSQIFQSEQQNQTDDNREGIE